MAKKKVVKKSTRSSKTSVGRMDNNTFLMIVGGGFVVVVLVFLLLGNSGMSTNTQTSSTPTPVTMTTDENEEDLNIVVTSPKEHEEIGRPVTITGRARVFENVISYRVKDADGFVLVSGSTMYTSEDAGEFGEFTITTNYLEAKGSEGTIEVYNASAKDGSDENLVSIPVTFR